MDHQWKEDLHNFLLSQGENDPVLCDVRNNIVLTTFTHLSFYIHTVINYANYNAFPSDSLHPSMNNIEIKTICILCYTTSIILQDINV